jgi:hypothetical protein
MEEQAVTPPAPDGLIGVVDAARILGIDPATVRQHLKAGVAWMPRATKVGGAWVFRRSDFEGIESRRREPGWPKSPRPHDGDAPTPPPAPDVNPAATEPPPARDADAVPAAEPVEADGWWDADA